MAHAPASLAQAGGGYYSYPSIDGCGSAWHDANTAIRQREDGQSWEAADVPFSRRPWAESRGDEYDHWGAATYYFWVHEGAVEQQVEMYESGVMLAYDRYHLEDEYGRRTDELLDPDEWSVYEIDIETYQRKVDGQPMNRRG